MQAATSEASRQSDSVYFKKVSDQDVSPAYFLEKLKTRVVEFNKLFGEALFEFQGPEKYAPGEAVVVFEDEDIAKIFQLLLSRFDGDRAQTWEGFEIIHCRPLEWERQPSRSLLQLQLKHKSANEILGPLQAFTRRFKDMISMMGLQIEPKLANGWLNVYFNGNVKSHEEISFRVRQYSTLCKSFFQGEIDEMKFATYQKLFEEHDRILQQRGPVLPISRDVNRIDKKLRVNFKNVKDLGTDTNYGIIVSSFAIRYKINAAAYSILRNRDSATCTISFLDRASTEEFKRKAEKVPERCLWREYLGNDIEITLPVKTV